MGFREHIISHWEKDFQLIFSSYQIERILAMTLQSSMSTRLQETNYKIPSRWYKTPEVLHKIYPESSPFLWRCGERPGSIQHILCQNTWPFWERVHRTAQKLTDYVLPDNPACFLLHLSDIPLKTYGKTILRHIRKTAKACIPAHWRDPNPPSTTGLERWSNFKKWRASSFPLKNGESPIQPLGTVG